MIYLQFFFSCTSNLSSIIQLTGIVVVFSLPQIQLGHDRGTFTKPMHICRKKSVRYRNTQCALLCVPGFECASNRLLVCENEIKIILLLSLLKYVACCSRYGANKAKRRRRKKNYMYNNNNNMPTNCVSTWVWVYWTWACNCTVLATSDEYIVNFFFNFTFHAVYT